MKILVDVKLKSKQSRVEKISEGHFVVKTTKEAKDNEANIDIIGQLSKYFKVPKSNIKISLGKTTKHKIVDISI
ncbi:MAG: DUF167 domain-containing protein [Candidatus Paceibacterota bacterium]|jgi:hypothetical protein